METNRQQKIARVIQQDIADVLTRALKDGGLSGVLISVTKVSVTSDLSIAKVYLSIFPTNEGATLLEGIKANKALIKHELAQRTRNQFRKMPDLIFYIDDSLEYINTIEKSLKGTENPIANPDLLDKRKKT
ncbi:30S ribosome-binding factor RbfA [Leptobacterium sp. I13]|uniref:30S ribosome-binding factor RbfA n=1 Tax=Leptobacterium meishanense TaxID=3128904 RepID=UPI0030EEEFB1